MILFQTVSKSYSKEIGAPAYTALNNLSFTVHQGETLGLIGANGAGKSTSIRLLMDFIRPDQGTIQLFNASPLSPRPKKIINLQFVITKSRGRKPEKWGSE